MCMDLTRDWCRLFFLAVVLVLGSALAFFVGKAWLAEQ